MDPSLGWPDSSDSTVGMASNFGALFHPPLSINPSVQFEVVLKDKIRLYGRGVRGELASSDVFIDTIWPVLAWLLHSVGFLLTRQLPCLALLFMKNGAHVTTPPPSKLF
ncbi:hypothetical protein COLO4_24738 [Corchorus olitorius]|uniref:Uncharacterized protein n=1 Tax=Corchorus olitorius TaxID=93759 RepID=A0A1R3I7G7_9ROSI|nr:hypothetical protein COLO4_24738 [Corchorus olitorius]